MELKIIRNVSLRRFNELMHEFEFSYSEFEDSHGRCFYRSYPVDGKIYQTRIYSSHSTLVSAENRLFITLFGL